MLVCQLKDANVRQHCCTLQLQPALFVLQCLSLWQHVSVCPLCLTEILDGFSLVLANSAVLNGTSFHTLFKDLICQHYLQLHLHWHACRWMDWGLVCSNEKNGPVCCGEEKNKRLSSWFTGPATFPPSPTVMRCEWWLKEQNSAYSSWNKLSLRGSRFSMFVWT